MNKGHWPISWENYGVTFGRSLEKLLDTYSDCISSSIHFPFTERERVGMGGVPHFVRLCCVCVCVCVCVSLSLSVCVSLSHSLSACVCLSLESMSWKGRVGDPYPLISPLGGIFFAVLLKTKGLCVQFQHFGTVHTEGTATDVVDLLCNTRFHKSQRVLCASLKKKKKKGGGCQLRQRRLTGNAPRHAYM